MVVVADGGEMDLTVRSRWIRAGYTLEAVTLGWNVIGGQHYRRSPGRHGDGRCPCGQSAALVVGGPRGRLGPGVLRR